jgi:hypothetical protein
MILRTPQAIPGVPGMILCVPKTVPGVRRMVLGVPGIIPGNRKMIPRTRGIVWRSRFFIKKARKRQNRVVLDVPTIQPCKKRHRADGSVLAWPLKIAHGFNRGSQVQPKPSPAGTKDPCRRPPHFPAVPDGTSILWAAKPAQR